MSDFYAYFLDNSIYCFITICRLLGAVPLFAQAFRSDEIEFMLTMSVFVKFPLGVVVSATPRITESYTDVPPQTCCTQTVRQVQSYTSSVSTSSSACDLQFSIKPTHFIWSVCFSFSVAPADFIGSGIISSIPFHTVLSISFRCAVSSQWSI